jgi:hypothetical protein
MQVPHDWGADERPGFFLAGDHVVLLNPSLEEAIRSAIMNVRFAGFDAERVEIEPDAVSRQA